MSICHIQGPKLQLKCSEDLMCLFKCGLFCVKYQMNYKQWWNINTFLFLKTIQWSEFFLTILCVWFINVWFCQKFCNYFSVNSYWGSPKGWVNMLKGRSPIIWPPVSSEVCLRRHWVRGRPVLMTQLWPWAWWDAESLRSLHRRNEEADRDLLLTPVTDSLLVGLQIDWIPFHCVSAEPLSSK